MAMSPTRPRNVPSRMAVAQFFERLRHTARVEPEPEPERDIRIEVAIDALTAHGISSHGWTDGDLVAHYDRNVRPAHAAQAEADALEHRRRHGEPDDDWRDRWCFAL